MDADYEALLSVGEEEFGVIEIEDQETEEEEEDDEEEEEYEDYEEGEQDEEEEEEEEGLIPAETSSPRVSNSVSHPRGTSQEALVIDEGLLDKSNDFKSCNGKIGSQENAGEDGEGELNRDEVDGLFCPICMEAWSSGGDHQICCLPCGHIYGLSCIKKWLQQHRSSGKCPQCKRKCTLKDVRVLYAARLCVVDADLQKKVRSLEAKCASLEQKVWWAWVKTSERRAVCVLSVLQHFTSALDTVQDQNADSCKKEVKSQEREAHLHLEVQELRKRTRYLESLLEDRQRESLGSFTASQGYKRSDVHGHGFDYGLGSQSRSGIFTRQRELQVDGGRYFDIDASGQLIIVARRVTGMGGMSLLTKISLIAPDEREDIQLPENLKAVRDLCVGPHSRLALLASLGKKLSVVSTESNNMVLSYDLPAPAWSCSWDVKSSHHVYTGLQNGMVLVFDMRQTRGPMESMTGLSCNPVHTVVSVAPVSTLPSGTRTILTASQIGVCEWNFGGTEERPYLVPESENQGVCISLAYSGGDNVVASFRPKIEMPAEMAVSQPSPTPSISYLDAGGVQGSHIFYKRMGIHSYQKTGSLLSQVATVRLPKSGIINKRNHSPMLASANDVTSDLVLHDISTLTVLQRLKTPKNQIWDVRCRDLWNNCLLGCLSGDTLQLFT